MTQRDKAAMEEEKWSGDNPLRWRFRLVEKRNLNSLLVVCLTYQ
jgi:hypothetical protein